MKLTTLVETRDLNTNSRGLFLRFQREDGSSFDMPCSMEQAAVVIQQATSGNGVPAAAAHPVPPTSPSESSFGDAMSDDEIENSDSIRLAAFGGPNRGYEEDSL